MKIRSLKLLVEQGNVSRVYLDGDKYFNVPGEVYEKMKNYIVYGEVIFEKVTDNLTNIMIIQGSLKEDFDIKVFSPEVQALALED